MMGMCKECGREMELDEQGYCADHAHMGSSTSQPPAPDMPPPAEGQ